MVFELRRSKQKPISSPEELMDAILEIEQSLGRERRVPKGPRLIDMDILLYGSKVIQRKVFGNSASQDGGAEIRAGAACGDRSRCDTSRAARKRLPSF